MKFTVFTPAYNRANTLRRVYESLLEQTITDFEWLIIDDGSTDLTCNLVSHFIKCQKRFPIRYHYQKHGGKHRAHNRAIALARGEHFIVADSDDWITPNALERIDHHWSRLPNKAGYCGIACLCADRMGRVIGTRYTPEMEHSTLNERKFKYGMKGEHWGSMLTSIVREYPFPDIDGFVPEGLVWLAIGKKYKDYCVNEVWRIYDTPVKPQKWPPVRLIRRWL